MSSTLGRQNSRLNIYLMFHTTSVTKHAETIFTTLTHILQYVLIVYFFLKKGRSIFNGYWKACLHLHGWQMVGRREEGPTEHCTSVSNLSSLVFESYLLICLFMDYGLIFPKIEILRVSLVPKTHSQTASGGR